MGFSFGSVGDSESRVLTSQMMYQDEEDGKRLRGGGGERDRTSASRAGSQARRPPWDLQNLQYKYVI